jgi:hypothetical protein
VTRIQHVTPETPEYLLDDLAKPLDLYIIEILSDAIPSMHHQLLTAFVSRKVYYGTWSITEANLEIRRALSKCPVKRWWFAARLRAYRKLPNRAKNYWNTTATVDEYASMLCAGSAAIYGRIIRL